MRGVRTQSYYMLSVLEIRAAIRYCWVILCVRYCYYDHHASALRPMTDHHDQGLLISDQQGSVISRLPRDVMAMTMTLFVHAACWDDWREGLPLVIRG